VVHGVKVPRKWPKTLEEEWKVPVGEGVASPVVVGDRVYVFSRHKDDESVVCLDLKTGKQIWRSKPYPAPYTVGIGEGTAEDRPRSTPAVAAGKVYTLGMSGVLSCLDARTGKLIWRKGFRSMPYGGQSPLVADGLCIVHVGDGKTGGLTAFDAGTGEVKWCYKAGGPSPGSPILANLVGHRQVVAFTTNGPVGVVPETGKVLWMTPWGPTPCTTPVQYKDLLLVAADKEPLRALRLEKSEKGITPREVWKAKGNPVYYSSPVLAGDLVFGLAHDRGGHFFCLDARTGKTLWQGPGRQGHASILNAGSVLLFLTNGGRLIVVKPGGKAYEPIAEYRVTDRGNDAHPVFLGDRILIKDRTALRSFRIEQDRGR
jgi:outer membrane protein assembly factor BamB